MKRNYRLAFGLFLFIIGCKESIHKVELFDSEGRLEEVYYLSDDSLRTGLSQSFFVETGALFMETSYEKGLEEGIRTTYFPSGKIDQTDTYLHGKFHGPSKSYYEDGQLKSASNFENDALEGEFINYYPSGQVKEKVHFIQNEENGPFIEFFPNGKIKAKGNYRNGDNEDGLLEIYNESGELIRKMNCQQGACKTIWKKTS